MPNIYIEPHEDGYSVTIDGNSRASVITRTQKQAIDWVAERHPDVKPNIARVRDVGPGPNKFRSK